MAADLDVLVAAYLLHNPRPDRYAMHDLVRHFAAELGQDREHAAEVARGQARLHRAVCADVLAAAAVIAPDTVALPRSGAPSTAAGRFRDDGEARTSWRSTSTAASAASAARPPAAATSAW